MVLKWPVTMTLHWVLYVLGIVCSGDCLSDLKSQSSWSENSAKTKQDVSVDSVCGGGGVGVVDSHEHAQYDCYVP